MKPSTYCKNCGAYIPDKKKKCLACGFPVDAPSLYGDINDLNPIEKRLNDYEAVCDKYAEMVFQDNYYGYVLEAANKVRQNIKQSKQKQQESKPDIDLDDLMEKTFVTVKINDKVSRFYFGARPQMCIADGRKFGCTFDGRVIGEGTKKKIDVCLVEA